MSLPAAEKKAREEIVRDLADGIDTRDQVLLCIVDEPNAVTIGYCWYQRNRQERIALVLDLQVLPTYRGAGRGTAARAILADDLAAEGFEEIRLRVAANNPRARHLYQSAGFSPTGTNMRKRIVSKSALAGPNTHRARTSE